MATRTSSGQTVNALAKKVLNLVAGAADLYPSTDVYIKEGGDLSGDNFLARNVHYGIREHGMGTILQGITLHQGMIAFGSTFLQFYDYMRPPLRLAAIMKNPLLMVYTHDSIGLGEDGPTHQPVEQVASLRAMPNLLVFRPADAIETAECWEAALSAEHRPSILGLTRQGLPALPKRAELGANWSAKGAYVVYEPSKPRQVTILSTGSEVQLALAAAKTLDAEGIAAAAVSMPCWELFRQQPDDYRRRVLGDTPRVAVEAAVRFGWDRFIGESGVFVGMTGFGASAPFERLYKEFGITAEAVAAAAKSKL
jgi:transketolase